MKPLSPADHATQAIPRSCCLLRLSALGDITHVLPLVHALRRHWPHCELTWIIGRRERALFHHLPGVRFIVFDKHGGLAAWRRIRRELDGQQFDLLLHLQTSLRSNLLSSLVKARRRVGWDAARAREGQRWFVNEFIHEQPPQHQVQGFLAFARHLGIAVAEPCWDFPVSTADQAFAHTILPPGPLTLLISPCSSHAKRDWPLAAYQQVAHDAVTRLRLRVIVCGGPGERERAYGAGIARVHPDIINFVGRDTLPQFCALLQHADVVLSPDSGPAHIANALGTPVIALHAATWSRRSGPYHSLEWCVDQFEEAARRYRQQPASALRWGTRIEQAGVMDLVTVPEVLEKLQQLTARLRRTGTLADAAE